MIKIQIIFVLRNKLCKYYGNLNMELMKGFKTAQTLNNGNCTCQQKVFNVEIKIEKDVIKVIKIFGS